METTDEIVLKPLNGEIPPEIARQMIDAYQSDATEKTRAVWFGLDQMNHIMDFLKAEEKAGMGTDGLRVYFGKYVQGTMKDVDPTYLGRNTVIFVSTKFAGYDPDDPKIKIHEDYFEHKASFTMIPENRGEICQPRCRGTKM
jgi:hypothetical protein